LVYSFDFQYNQLNDTLHFPLNVNAIIIQFQPFAF
jgi:hypothetical protein